jgi:hypothetical protein
LKEAYFMEGRKEGRVGQKIEKNSRQIYLFSDHCSNVGIN